MVLLSVLLVSVFLVSASTGFAIFARRTSRRFDREQRLFTARMASEIVLDAAKVILSLHKENYHSAADPLFAGRTFGFPDAGVAVTMRIEPLDDKIPLNKLLLPDGKTLRRELEEPWKAMWRAVEAEELQTLVLDFIDKDTEPRLGGAERPGFLNRQLLSVDELRLVPGITPEIISGVLGRPGIESMATIWSSGKINLNVAPVEVLVLLEGIDARLAAEIVKVREERPFSSLSGLSAIPNFPSSAAPKLMNIAVFKSEWFRVSFEVLFEDGEILDLHCILNGKPMSWNTVRWEEP